MLTRHVGQAVIVTHETVLAYEGNVRKHVRIPVKEPNAIITGMVKRALGKYVRGGYDDQAYLKVDKYVWLYECRRSLTGKSFLVDPSDIVGAEE